MAIESASDRPPFNTRKMFWTTPLNPGRSVSSAAIPSARSTGTPEFRRVESSCVKNSTSFRVEPLSEPGPEDADWAGERGLVTEVLARLLPDARKHEAYMCGPPGMIDAAVAVLSQNGCKPRHIYFDRFVPSG